MQQSKNWFSSDIPARWDDLFIRIVIVAVVSFVMLQLKELYDAGAFDTEAALVDTALISGALFVLYAILMRFKT